MAFDVARFMADLPFRPSEIPKVLKEHGTPIHPLTHYKWLDRGNMPLERACALLTEAKRRGKTLMLTDYYEPPKQARSV